MTTISVAAHDLGVTRDQLWYIIKKRKAPVTPTMVNKRYLLSNDDIETLRTHIRTTTSTMGALLEVYIRGSEIRSTVDELANRFPEVVWSAGVWGEMSVIAFLEATKFENISSIPFRLQDLRHIANTRTYVIPHEHYHIKPTPEIQGTERIAIILLNLERAPELATFVMNRLGDIPEVRRYGNIFGPWDGLAEVRYEHEDDLQRIVLEEIHNITGVENTTSILTMTNMRAGEDERGGKPGIHASSSKT